MQSKLLSTLLLSGAVLAAGQALADPAAPAAAAKGSQDVSLTGGAATAPATGSSTPAAADTGAVTKSKKHKKKAGAPAVPKPQSNIESHQPAYR